jgi:hypothetical protein
MRQIQITELQKQFLRDQVISLDQPGTILQDFQRLLDFVGSRAVEAAGKYNLLPIKFIDELDLGLSRPLRLELKRPQIKSHPYIQGLNLLLRATGLSRIEGTGAKARLVLDPAMMLVWERLNPTERYFNLLEAWLRHARSEMIGERSRFSSPMTWTIIMVCQTLPEKGLRFDLTKPEYFSMPTLYSQNYQVALMDLFGLVKVEHSPRPVTPWMPLAVEHCPFGDAALGLLSNTNLYGEIRRDFLGKPSDEDDPEAKEPDFGAWQPLFQPYFPEWRDNLEFLLQESQEGEFIFRVSLGKVWRRIALSSDQTLEDMVKLILKSVGFGNDHLYELTYRDPLGVPVSFLDSRCDDGPWANEYEIGDLGLQVGQTIELTYDFGDNWKFKIKLEKIEPVGLKAKKPRILESHGKSPKQYSDWDDDDEEAVED